ncbi:MAG: geranylgeranylglycerol-phosphate geranylgeranyltransferase [Flavobacteriales bacterium]|nr:geranylgeranylglycerol-phosphate geranylgeranyltransferase [Flavobacteriales bacterium]
MLDLLRLARPLNLLIMALTMALIRYGLVLGWLERGLNELLQEVGGGITRGQLTVEPGFGPQLPLWLFLLLVLSVVLIGAAGNIINDYFDTRIDRINKPDQVLVGRTVKRRVAMAAHLVLSSAGLLCGAIVAWRTGQWPLLIIPAFAIGALWTYSTTFKRQLIIGNGTVATLTALVPLTVGLYEVPALQHSFHAYSTVTLPDDSRYGMESSFTELWWWVLGFAGFAFLSSLVRELQKDMADVKGDAAQGCRTIPIAWGMRWAKALVLLYIASLILALLALHMLVPALRGNLAYWYIQLGIIAPLLLSAGFTYNANRREEHNRAGALMKVAMVMGAGFAAIIRFL